jgi:hypothetical protein
MDGSEDTQLMRSFDAQIHSKKPIPKPRKGSSKRANISLSSKFVADLQENKKGNNSTCLEMETESENGRTPIKVKIGSLDKGILILIFRLEQVHNESSIQHCR